MEGGDGGGQLGNHFRGAVKAAFADHIPFLPQGSKFQARFRKRKRAFLPGEKEDSGSRRDEIAQACAQGSAAYAQAADHDKQIIQENVGQTGGKRKAKA